LEELGLIATASSRPWCIAAASWCGVVCRDSIPSDFCKLLDEKDAEVSVARPMARPGQQSYLENTYLENPV